ncbi:MAG TPA: ABC transporter ATP-binding protein [Gammaproteobacteria bacterium]|nr:ABC transporter ATP-binding protein [Gammaproteobacteria bacterium]
MAALIDMQNVEKSVPQGENRLFLLRQISLTVPDGDFVTLMGPSGAGKSTLLSILGLLDADWNGEYYLAGNAVHALPQRKRQSLTRDRIGFIFQHYHLLDDMTVYENLELPLTYRDTKTGDRQSRVADILDRFNIVGKKDLYPRQLSGGQQQLVAVGRAVITQPSLILADEPTGALHSSQGKIIMALLKDLNAEGTTVIQVTHNEDNAAYGNRTLQLFDGWLSD